MFEPEFKVSPRVFSVPGARIWVNSSTCEESQRGGGMSPTQCSEFVIVHLAARPLLDGPSVDHALTLAFVRLS
jgi:hypothetical protein